MLYNMFHGKIHRATVTQANLNYMGSITIDSELLEASGLLPGERGQIVDNNNGSRIETYIIPGEPGSGVICLNGAAARCVHVGDIVIIMGYALMTPEEAKSFFEALEKARSESNCCCCHDDDCDCDGECNCNHDHEGCHCQEH